MLKNLTTNINQNGLVARSTFGVDTTGATEVQELAGSITDSQGPGGGGIHLKKCGAGTLKLSGANTFSGQTIVEGGKSCCHNFQIKMHVCCQTRAARLYFGQQSLEIGGFLLVNQSLIKQYLL